MASTLSEGPFLHLSLRSERKWTVALINVLHNMSTTHPINAYTSNYHHQLASQPHQQHPQPPQPQYPQPHSASNQRLPGPVQIARTGSKDSNSSGQPSPRRDGRDSHANREKREVWDPRVERKNRPATIAELADKSREDLSDTSKHLKHWLRIAELARKSGKQYAENGDYERSFIHLARAATIILEGMPAHKDYKALLTESQRTNLVLVSLSLSLSLILILAVPSHARCAFFNRHLRFIFAPFPSTDFDFC